MKNVVLRAKFTVPLYNVTVHFVIARNAGEALDRSKLFDEEKGQKFQAICVSDGEGDFGLFFTADKISADDIGHEMPHLVEAIMTFIGNACIKCDEPRAYLSGYLNKRIAQILRKRKFKLNP